MGKYTDIVYAMERTTEIIKIGCKLIVWIMILALLFYLAINLIKSLKEDCDGIPEKEKEESHGGSSQM